MRGQTSCAVLLSLVATTAAWGQVVGGGGGMVSPSATGGGFAPPSMPLEDKNARGGLAPVRGNQPITTNALMGFVNSEPVFVQDVLRPIDDNLRRVAKSARNLGEFRKEAGTQIQAQLKTYVSEKLIVTAAERTLTDSDKAKIELFLAVKRNELLTRHGGSIALADKALATTGSSVAKEMADLRRATIVKLYMGKHLSPKIVVTRQMLLDAYEHDAKRWQEEAQVELYTITLRVDRWLREPSVDGKLGELLKNPTPEQVKAAQAQAMTTAQEVVNKLRGGANFAELVEDFGSSDPAKYTGGRTAALKRGSLADSKLEEYVFSLPANTLGEPQMVMTPVLAVVIPKVGAKKEARVIPFAEAQGKIHEALWQKQYKDLSGEHMMKLYQGAAVEAVERNTDLAVEAAVARYVTQ